MFPGKSLGLGRAPLPDWMRGPVQQMPTSPQDAAAAQARVRAEQEAAARIAAENNAIDTQQFLQNRAQTRQDNLSDTLGLGTIATGMDMAGGIPQYLTGEAMGAMGVDPGSLIVRGSEAAGINPMWGLAAGAAALGSGRVRKAAMNEVRKGRARRLLELSPAEKKAAAEAAEIALQKKYKTPVARAIYDAEQSMGESVPADIKKSIKTKFNKGAEVPEGTIQNAMATRKRLLAEPRTTPTGKHPSEMSNEEFREMGAQYGRDWTVHDMEEVLDPVTGRKWRIPGGEAALRGEVKMTYPDLFQLKGEGHDPNDWSPQFHDMVQKAMTSASVPDNLTDNHVFRGMQFGIASPNVPLHNTQMQVNRLRPRTPEDLDKLASYTRGAGPIDKTQRNAITKQMASDYGIAAGYGGGSGNIATNDLSRMSDMAQVFQRDPQLFRQKPGEQLRETSDRLSNMVPGLNTKTADMGVVWQDITRANTAPMDRHMADLYVPQLLADPVLGPRFQKEAVTAWNAQAKKEAKKFKGKVAKARPGRKVVKDWDELSEVPAGPAFADAELRKSINRIRTMGTKTRKGLLNEDVPEHLRDLPGDPKSVKVRGEKYEGALDHNAGLADDSDMSLYQKQWQLWEGKRKQVNPHESMHPDLEYMPRMSWSDQQDANKYHRSLGFAQTGKKIKPGDWKKLFYYMAPPVAAGAGGLLSTREEDRRE